MNELIAGIAQAVGFSTLAASALTGAFLLIRGRGQDTTAKDVQRTELTSLKPPTWAEMIQRQDELAKRVYAVERRADALRDTFVHYVERVQNGGSTTLTDRERILLYQDPPLEGSDEEEAVSK